MRVVGGVNRTSLYCPSNRTGSPTASRIARAFGSEPKNGLTTTATGTLG